METSHAGHASEGNALGHDHSHDHRATSRRSLLVVLGLICCHMVVEVTGGLLSGSLGLLAHATHLVTDAVAICLALLAMWIAERPATATSTFGHHRVEVLVVLLNVLALWGLGGWILYEAYLRFSELSHGHEHGLNGGIMLVVAIIGLSINVFAAWTLYRSTGHSINVEGAFWHVVAELAGSVAVLVSSVLVLLFDWDLVDPILSVLLGGLIIVGSSRLAIKVYRILMELTPAGLDMYLLCSRVEDVEGVTVVHDVHAWTITTGYNALAAHVLVDPGYQGNIEMLMRSIRRIIREEFGIDHVTLQVEQSASECSEYHHVDHLSARTG